MNVDPKILDYGNPTPRQRELIEAIIEHGGARAAARALNASLDLCGRAYRDVAKKAALQGYAPANDMRHTVPDGFKVRGVSTYYDSDGKPRGQWVKSSADDERREEMARAFAEGLSGDIVPLPPIPRPEFADANLLTVIPLGDPHFGLLTWGEEVGANFDLAIAERLTFAAVDRICARTPSSHTALLLNLGDFFHADNASNRTPRSGAELDVDGRFQKIATVGVRAIERCIMRLLEKHERVIVRNNRGNHDPHQAAMLTICMAMRFHDNPRVTIETNPSSFYYLRWGRTLIGSTHGDGAKLADLPMIMATDVPHEWAAATWRVWHCGHFHHNQTMTAKDNVGVTVETHRTLAANDAWHRHAGYRSHRDIKAIVYDLNLGEVERLRCGVEELAA